ncbi:MAG TPA: DUF6502 family protein [Steroidobacteraceae bacterium]|nr:DUF6502 family protein [Steroidobacteraceae bacterium]
MALASSEQVLQSTHQWLQPLVHILLACGVTWREFADLSKSTYVEVATSHFGKRGRPTNVSRTAVLTGLARREVRRQRERLASAPEKLSGYVTKASLVLSVWHLDPEFADKSGRPAALKMTGRARSFEALLERCGGGDVPPTTLLKELVSAGAVRVRADGRIQALQRDYIPHTLDEQLIRLWGTVIADVAATYVHNLTKRGKSPLRFERSAVNDRIPVSAIPAFQKLLEREGQALLERIDRWLTAEQAAAAQSDTKTVRLGVGVYEIQD